MITANMLETFRIDWPAHRQVNALTTTRVGGISRGVYRGLNLGDHVNDDRSVVNHNRKLLRTELKLRQEPKWLCQVHGLNIVDAANLSSFVEADGSFTTQRHCVCVVLTADCLPVFISDIEGAMVGLFHAGWRGLANGILVKAVEAMGHRPGNLIAALGPAISRNAFEVGVDVKHRFETNFSGMSRYFTRASHHDKYFADLYGIAEAQLSQLGVGSVWLPGDVCTYADPQRFYSYRRDGQTGRMASLIWID